MMLEKFTLILEFILLIVKWWYFTIESIYKLVFPSEQVDVRDEIVLITGTGNGIGKHTALQYSKLGSIVICVDINEKLNNGTVQEILESGGKAYGFVCDVSNRQAINELSQKITTQIGNVTILVNNAGIMPTHSLLEHSESEIRRIFEINVFAHFWILQAFLPQMIENRKGHIVAVASMCGLAGMCNLVPYCASKFAVRGMMDALEQEINLTHKNAGIKFTSVYPYMVDTGLCKKPFVRFPSIMSLVKTEDAASIIVEAQRRGLHEVTVPRMYYYGFLYISLFPSKCIRMIREFFECGVHSDLN